jgi:hypothetical protein
MKALEAPLRVTLLLVVAPAIAFSMDSQVTPAGTRSASPGQYASEVPRDALLENPGKLFGDQQSLPIAQDVEEIVNQHVEGRGGYDILRRIASVDYYGTRFVHCEHYPLERHTARPSKSSTKVKIGDAAEFQSMRSSGGIAVQGVPRGLRIEQERALLQIFDFDGSLINWTSKNYDVRDLGMEKLPGILAWKLEVRHPDGYREVLYLNSHHGDIVKEILVDPSGAEMLQVSRHDFRSVDGSRFPFAIDYKEADGTLLASDRLQRVEVKR